MLTRQQRTVVRSSKGSQRTASYRMRKSCVWLTSILQDGPRGEASILKHSAVGAVMSRFIPRNVDLSAWVENRIGGEVLVNTNEKRKVYALVQDADKMESHRKHDGFFDSLPLGSFSPKELALRTAIFDFLATWKSNELASLSHVGGDANVRKAKADLLPSGASLRDWIERRIGGEIELKELPNNKFVLHLKGAALGIVQQRFQQLQYQQFSDGKGRGKGAPPPPPALPDETHRERADDVEDNAVRDAFFALLPDNELTSAEADLRETLISVLKTWNPKPGQGMHPSLSFCGMNKTLQAKKGVLLPKGVTFRDWIDRRIGGEVATKKSANGQVVLLLRGRGASSGGMKRAPPAGGPPPPPETEEDREAKEAQKALQTEDKEAFFDSLPIDGFGPEEEKLRLALLDFIGTWNFRRGPPSLSAAGSLAEIRDGRAALLTPHKVSLREWIERRVGGEIETFQNGNGDVCITTVGGLRGETGAAKRGRGGDVGDTLASRGAGGDDDAEARKAQRQQELADLREAFFSTLPSDGFTPEEETMRELLVHQIENWDNSKGAPTMTAFGSIPEIREAKEALLPKGCQVSLTAWIQQRIGGEVELGPSSHGRETVIGFPGQLALTVPPPRNDHSKQQRGSKRGRGGGSNQPNKRAR